MLSKIPRVLLSAVSSGSGKTTVTCAILQALVNRGLRVTSFKCGPDYIDPMFHSRVIGTESRNLDTFFTDENITRFLCARTARTSDIAVIEGVMGHYDGIAGITTQASAYALSKTIAAPVVLIVDCKGMSVSIAAIIKGFLSYRADANIQGVLLNRISPMMYGAIKQLIEEELPIKVYGYLPVLSDCTFGSRHLGLITAGEIADLKQKMEILAEHAEKSIDLDGLVQLANSVADFSYQALSIKPIGHPKIAVARDAAFCFLYEDNLELLRELGAELLFFSPMTDPTLPEAADALLLSGGYPELYARELSENVTMRASIRTAIQGGMPCIAECGGFLYLHQSLQTQEQEIFPMTGLLHNHCRYTGKLGRFGYVTLTAAQDNLLCKQGEQLRAHEFHYFDSDDCGEAFIAEKPVRQTSWSCIHATETLIAGYPHLYLYANPNAAKNFVQAGMVYREKKKGMENQ